MIYQLYLTLILFNSLAMFAAAHYHKDTLGGILFVTSATSTILILLYAIWT
jgi:hypothetical protein|tara:strand:+ start:1054 stop:1206 length:153 start_codon:yes stop_codon:yes gene_type:complete